MTEMKLKQELAKICKKALNLTVLISSGRRFMCAKLFLRLIPDSEFNKFLPASRESWLDRVGAHRLESGKPEF